MTLNVKRRQQVTDMSMNNYILIKKKNAKYFSIQEKDADTDIQIGKSIIVSSAEEALEKASEIESEYNIVYIDKTRME